MDAALRHPPQAQVPFKAFAHTSNSVLLTYQFIKSKFSCYMLLLIHTTVNTCTVSPTAGSTGDKSACSCSARNLTQVPSQVALCGTQVQFNELSGVRGLLCCSWSLKAVLIVGLMPAFLGQCPMIHLDNVVLTLGIVFQELPRYVENYKTKAVCVVPA